MGYNPAELRVTARLSAHNDERDDEHLQLWDDLRAAIAVLIRDPKYADIDPVLY